MLGQQQYPVRYRVLLVGGQFVPPVPELVRDLDFPCCHYYSFLIMSESSYDELASGQRNSPLHMSTATSPPIREIHDPMSGP